VSALRILLLAPEANPESPSNPTVGYYHAEALARVHKVTLVIYASSEEPVRRGGGAFHAIEPVRLPWLDPLYEWALRRVFKRDHGRLTLTAASYPRHVFFEIRAWRQLRSRILSGDYDVVLRILPYHRAFPSPFAWLLRNGPIPFVIGPISGSLPWATGFPQLDKQRRAPGHWIWNLTAIARYVPFARSTYTKASAIVAGSSHTHAELARHREKLFFIPTEIGINPALFEGWRRSPASHDGKLKLLFVGRLVPFKACDLALRGAAQLLRAGAAHLTVVGDGPERENFERLTRSLDIEGAVRFAGWLPQPEVLKALQDADVLVFPSLREIGGGVVFEALSMGAVPVVADFGGPGDVVNPDVGYKIPMSNENEMISKLESVLKKLGDDRNHLENLRERGMAYARESLTYDAKARVMTDILLWATGRGPKPHLQPPRRPVAVAQNADCPEATAH
jgi:glycosyltransferase involved in cell wall biosynthesis